MGLNDNNIIEFSWTKVIQRIDQKPKHPECRQMNTSALCNIQTGGSRDWTTGLLNYKQTHFPFRLTTTL